MVEVGIAIMIAVGEAANVCQWELQGRGGRL